MRPIMIFLSTTTTIATLGAEGEVLAAVLALVSGRSRLEPIRGRDDPSSLYHFRLGGGLLHPGFRIQKEVSRSDDALARLQTADNLHAVVESPAGLYLARLKVSIAAIHEDRFLETGIEHRVHRDGHRGRQYDAERHVHEHVRPQRQSRVVHFQTDLEGPRGGVELRQDVADLGAHGGAHRSAA